MTWLWCDRSETRSQIIGPHGTPDPSGTVYGKELHLHYQLASWSRPNAVPDETLPVVTCVGCVVSIVRAQGNNAKCMQRWLRALAVGCEPDERFGRRDGATCMQKCIHTSQQLCKRNLVASSCRFNPSLWICSLDVRTCALVQK